MSFPPANEMFQFAGFASRAYLFSAGYSRRSGLPHSEIRGSKFARNSPRLIATCYVLHRLSVPRHPPNALKRLRRETARRGKRDTRDQGQNHPQPGRRLGNPRQTFATKPAHGKAIKQTPRRKTGSLSPPITTADRERPAHRQNRRFVPEPIHDEKEE
jgi:hypothetical protein